MPTKSRRDHANPELTQSTDPGTSQAEVGCASQHHGNSARLDTLRSSGDVQSAPADPFDVESWMKEGLDCPLPGRGRLESLLGVSFAGVTLRVGVSALDDLSAEGGYQQGVLSFAETRPSEDTILHEAVHFAQAQQNGETSGKAVSSPNDDAEQEAESAIQKIKAGEPVALEESVHGVMRRSQATASRAPYGSGLRENKKRSGNNDQDTSDLGKDIVSDRVGVVVGGADALRVQRDTSGYFDDLNEKKLKLTKEDWCFINPAAPRKQGKETFVFCQVVRDENTNNRYNSSEKPRGSAWVSTIDLDAKNVAESVKTYREQNNLNKNRGFTENADGGNSKITKTSTFKTYPNRPNRPYEKSPTSRRYIKPGQDGVANRLTDYGYRVPRGLDTDHNKYQTDTTLIDEKSWYNICINLSSQHGAGVPNALARPGEEFVVYKSKDQKVNTYKPNADKPQKAETFRFGHIKGDKNRYGWVWGKALE